MKIYVASSWRCTHQPGVVVALREAGHEVYDFRNPAPGNSGFHWSEIDPNWKGWTPREYIDALAHPIAVEGYRKDFLAMEWADACVLVLPSGRSAHLEAGYFAGARKPVIVLIPEPIEPELMYRLLSQPLCTTVAGVIAQLRRAAPARAD